MTATIVSGCHTTGIVPTTTASDPATVTGRIAVSSGITLEGTPGRSDFGNNDEVVRWVPDLLNRSIDVATSREADGCAPPALDSPEPESVRLYTNARSAADARSFGGEI
jgi:hypothetical protein